MMFVRPASGWRLVAAAWVWGLSMMMADKTPAADNLNFVGNLVAQACSIRPGDEAIELLFDDQSSHYLYINTRTQSVPFYIHLVGCGTSIANTVTALFSGVENTELPGLLALATGSRARGIAIGLESAAGQLLPLNVTSDPFVLADGDNVMSFQAYVRGEPKAIANHTIRAGRYSAVSTFTLVYP